MSKHLMERNSQHLYVETLRCNGAVSWGTGMVEGREGRA